MSLLKQYYQAWETKDLELLESLLHPSLFGVRTYDELVLFEQEEVLQACASSDHRSYNVFDIIEENNVIHYSLRIQTTNTPYDVVAKAIIKDHKIYKIYEEIKQDTKRIRCICMYDGSPYNGYQKQPNANSIQETIETALQQAFSLSEPPTIHASGRTDKGVHATHQVFHFDIDTKIPVEKMQDIINSYLPHSIHITEVEQTEQTFHSRYDVISKEYMYKINKKHYNPIQRNYEWFVKDLNMATFIKELNTIKGTHDFTTFTKKTDKNPLRTITNVRVKDEDDYVYVYIEGNGFMRYMVRYLIGALVSISTNKLQTTMLELIAKKDVQLLKDMAPPGGLYLYKVHYE